MSSNYKWVLKFNGLSCHKRIFDWLTECHSAFTGFFCHLSSLYPPPICPTILLHDFQSTSSIPSPFSFSDLRWSADMKELKVCSETVFPTLGSTEETTIHSTRDWDGPHEGSIIQGLASERGASQRNEEQKKTEGVLKLKSGDKHCDVAERAKLGCQKGLGINFNSVLHKLCGTEKVLSYLWPSNSLSVNWV